MDFGKYFKLEMTDYRLLLVIQKQLILNDIELTTDKDRRIIKEDWFWEWQKNVTRAINQKEFPSFTDSFLQKKFSSLDPETQNLIFLEAIAFLPYFIISDRGSGTTKGLEKLNEDFRIGWVMKLQSLFPKKTEVIDEIKITYSYALKEIMGKDWSNSSRNKSILAIAGAAVALAVTGGVAAPLIGGIIGSTFLGLSGAAATSAGLAFLGGGALAAGGLGMAGGTALIIGGGAILGSIVGANISNEKDGVVSSTLLSAFDTNYVLTNCSKIVTITKLIAKKEDRASLIVYLIDENEKNITNLSELKNKSGKSFKKVFEKTSGKLNDKDEATIKNTIEKNIGLIINTNAILGQIMANQWPKEK